METSAENAFECLYFLQGLSCTIVEIKRNDLVEEAPINEKFQWLKISDDIKKLTFRSMDSSNEIEERYFEEGFLKFNSLEGTFIEKYNSAQYVLLNKPPRGLPSEILKKISDFMG